MSNWYLPLNSSGPSREIIDGFEGAHRHVTAQQQSPKIEIPTNLEAMNCG
jgi:hypothetical protein